MRCLLYVLFKQKNVTNCNKLALSESIYYLVFLIEKKPKMDPKMAAKAAEEAH